MTGVQRKRPEHWAAATPDVPAVVDGDRQLTYHDWNLAADQLAEAMLGFGPENQRVCVCLHQCPEWFVVNLALAKIGWEHIAISWRLTVAEQLRLIEACGAGILITDGAGAGEIARARPGGRLRVVAVGRSGLGIVPFASLLDGATAPPRWSRRPAPFVKYTSGTTGEPKGVRRPAPATEQQRQWRLESDRGPLERMRAAMADGSDFHHRALLTLPMHHGIGPRGARACHNEGGTCYLLDRYDPAHALRLISAHGITHWTTVPTMLQRMRSLPAEVLAPFDVSSMRMLAVGSAPVPMALKEWALGYFGPCLFEAYGASEIGLVTLMEPLMHLRKPGSCGALRPHVSVRVLGADGREQPPGATGELYVRTPLTIDSYVGAARAGQDLLSDGYFRTGDLGHLDEDGYLYITGRIKDLIIRGGVNHSPAEVEAVLLRHPDVTGAAVIGIPDQEFGEQAAAFCEVRSAATVDAVALLEFACARLVPDKRPAQVEIVTALPRNDMGKVIKAELRRPYWAGHEFSFGR
jgi:long-chain acyl-CoA synthetase